MMCIDMLFLRNVNFIFLFFMDKMLCYVNFFEILCSCLSMVILLVIYFCIDFFDFLCVVCE